MRSGNQFPTPFETTPHASPLRYAPLQYRYIHGPKPTSGVSMSCPPCVWPDSVSGMPAAAAWSSAWG